MKSGAADVMPCPRCGIDQARAKIVLAVTGRMRCRNCGTSLRIRGYELLIGIVRAGLAMLPVALFLAWIVSAWWLLVLPAIWWAALLYLLLPWHDH